MLRHRWLYALVLTSPLLGCHSLTDAQFNGGLGLSAETAVFVPFSEPKEWKFYGESRRGQFLVEAMKGWAASNWNAEFPDDGELEQALDMADRSNKETLSARDWKVFLRAMGVKYAVVGEIRELSMTNPKRVAMLSPKMQTSFRVINLESGRVAYSRKNKVVTYGDYGSIDDRELTSVDLGPMEQNRRKFETGLITRMAEAICKDLYGYYPD